MNALMPALCVALAVPPLAWLVGYFFTRGVRDAGGFSHRLASPITGRIEPQR
jgi:hypothetical protein